MCRILNVSRSGYYEWTNNSGSNRAEQDKKLIAMIRTICKEGRNTYGTRRIKTILERQGIVISRKAHYKADERG
jgi:putative transposase